MNELVQLEKVLEEIDKAFDRFMADARMYTDVYRLRKQKEELVDQIQQIERWISND